MARDLSNRLLARNEGLSRRQMPGGGEAFSGAVADQALQAVGARAMTMDNSVFVQSKFDPSKKEDLALWGHEQHHLNNSGGSDDHGEYDSEEQAARARERLILHQAGAGMDPDSILGNVDSSNPQTAKQADEMFAEMEGNGSEDGSGEPDPMEAYRNMIKDGMSHQQIVSMLADHVTQTQDRQQAETSARSAGEAT